MTTHIEGAKNILGRCMIEKSQKSAQIDVKDAFTIIAEQMADSLGTILPLFKSNLALFSAPVYEQNMHIYHVHEDDNYVGEL